MNEVDPPAVPSIHFVTEALPIRQRFDAWQAALSELHDTQPAGGQERDSISIATTVWSLDGLVVTCGRFSAQSRLRDKGVIHRSSLDGYRVTLPVAGSSIGLETGGDRKLLRPGEMFITDFSRADRQESTETSEAIGVFLPREAVARLLPQPPDLHGLVIEGPLALLFRDHLIGIARMLGAQKMPMAALPAVAEATLHLFSAVVAGAPPAEGEARLAVDSGLRRRIMAYVEEHLLDRDLSHERLCQVFHMSRATLYRLFQPFGGVASHVQERRLARIHVELRDPTRHHHMGRLAEIYGFASQAHMGRVYKAQYGQTPSETAGGDLPSVSAPRPTSEPGYQRWLRSLSKLRSD